MSSQNDVVAVPIDMPAQAGTGGVKSSAASNAAASKINHYIESIQHTDITRINGYLRIANIGSGAILGLLGLVDLFSMHSYKDFLVSIYVLVLSAMLVLFEFREKFPVMAEKTKLNFGFMFTGFGRAVYILWIALLAFTQGLFGCIAGIGFLLLAAFNFFIIMKHPAYQNVMRSAEPTQPANNNVPLPVPVALSMPSASKNEAIAV